MSQLSSSFIFIFLSSTKLPISIVTKSVDYLTKNKNGCFELVDPLGEVSMPPPPLRFDLHSIEHEYTVSFENKFEELARWEEDKSLKDLSQLGKDAILQTAQDQIPISYQFLGECYSIVIKSVYYLTKSKNSCFEQVDPLGQMSIPANSHISHKCLLLHFLQVFLYYSCTYLTSICRYLPRNLPMHSQLPLGTASNSDKQ